MNLPKASLVAAAGDGIDVLWDPDAYEMGLLVAFTGRRGGVSNAPFDSLNLSVSVGDALGAVHENCARVGAVLGFDAGALARSRQVHGAGVIEALPGACGVLGDADGLVARAPGPVVAVLTADCAPVALAGDGGAALLHAGWRGLVAGIIERGCAAIGPVHAAWVGPCIHACCYEVGDEVVEAFRRRGLPVAGSRRVDPGRAAIAVLRRCGVPVIAAAGECTACEPSYFSYRRDGLTGRQGGFVALRDGTSPVEAKL